MTYPWWVYVYLVIAILCCPPTMCRTYSPNPLIPQQAGVIPTSTGSHYQGILLRYIERAASAAKPLYICILCINCMCKKQINLSPNLCMPGIYMLPGTRYARRETFDVYMQQQNKQKQNPRYDVTTKYIPNI